jgi:hypothetical protein
MHLRVLLLRRNSVMREQLFILRIAYLLNLYCQSYGGNTAHSIGLIKISQLLEQTCKQIEHYYYRYILYPKLVPYKQPAAPSRTLARPLAPEE